MPVVKDLVPDLTHAYAQLTSIEPWLKTDTPAPEGKERKQSPEERQEIDGMWECVLCFSCTTSCPSYWWNGDRYLDPGKLCHLHRIGTYLPPARSRVEEEKHWSGPGAAEIVAVW